MNEPFKVKIGQIKTFNSLHKILDIYYGDEYKRLIVNVDGFLEGIDWKEEIYVPTIIKVWYFHIDVVVLIEVCKHSGNIPVWFIGEHLNKEILKNQIKGKGGKDGRTSKYDIRIRNGKGTKGSAKQNKRNVKKVKRVR